LLAPGIRLTKHDLIRQYDTDRGAGTAWPELGYQDFVILKVNGYVGLAISFNRRAGFTHDIGGHIIFQPLGYHSQFVEKLIA
jgi:hypothetical protein